MELIWWPRATRSTTCEQDRCVCGILHISSWRYGRIVTLFGCINDDYNLHVCVILHIASWRYDRIVTLFWCINDVCNLCVWFCISRDMLLWLSLCSTIFCMIYLLTCKACDYLNSLANQLVSLRIPDLDLASEIMPDCWRWTLFYLAYLFRSWQSTRFSK
jgi:hypothetical protein